LGLAATLWATLVGQTVPQLLDTENAQRSEFSNRVEAVCRDAQAWTASRSEDSFAGLVGIVPSGDDVKPRALSGMYDMEAGWSRITAPEIYAAQYAEFRAHWTAAFGALYFDFPGGDSLVVALARWRVAQRLARDGSDPGGHVRARAKRRIDGPLLRADRALGGAIVTSIAMSLPGCRRAADNLRDSIDELAPA
jgi:hypothetical protein